MKSRAVSAAYGETKCLLQSASPVAKLHIKIQSTSTNKGYEGRVDTKSRLFERAADIEE